MWLLVNKEYGDGEQIKDLVVVVGVQVLLMRPSNENVLCGTLKLYFCVSNENGALSLDGLITW